MPLCVQIHDLGVHRKGAAQASQSARANKECAQARSRSSFHLAHPRHAAEEERPQRECAPYRERP
eukprot:1161769-Pelagomonas_calceolata.AAC.10